MYKIRKIFDEFKIIDMDFALERGDPNDFKGIDVILTIETKDIYKNREKIKIQVKGGRVISYNEEGYLVSGSANDLKADVNYWCYIDIKDKKTEIVLFQNINRYIERIGYNILFKKEIIHPIKIEESIMVPEKLDEIAKYCYDKKILIEIEHLPQGVNEVILQKDPEKIINIKIADFKDKNLIILLTNKFDELKKFFN